MKKEVRVGLLERMAKDERSTKRGPRCSVCEGSHVDKINDDLREYVQLRKEGVSCSFTWLVETNFFDQYGIKTSRQACIRHMNRCLGLK